MRGGGGGRGEKGVDDKVGVVGVWSGCDGVVKSLCVSNCVGKGVVWVRRCVCVCAHDTDIPV